MPFDFVAFLRALLEAEWVSLLILWLIGLFGGG